MSKEQDSFGARLRRARERRGLTVQAIAESTKIKASLLSALERNDVSHWPAGIFRRAFVREYAAAVGLPPEPLVAEFVLLFPEPGDAALVETPRLTDPAELRLTLDRGAPGLFSISRRQFSAAAVDLGAVMAIAGAATIAGAAAFWTAVALVSVAYFTAGTACLGRSIGSWWMASGRLSLGAGRHVARKALPRLDARLDPREILHLAASRPPSQAWRPQ